MVQHQKQLRLIQLLSGKIKSIELLGSKEKLSWKRTSEGLQIKVPKISPCDFAFSFRINGDGIKSFTLE